MEVIKGNYSVVKTTMCQYITLNAMEGQVKAKVQIFRNYVCLFPLTDK